MTRHTHIVEFTTPMTERELKVAIGQAIAPITEMSNAIGRQIAEADSFVWVKHPFNNITYEDRQVSKSCSSLPYHTTHDFQFRMVDGQIQQYTLITLTVSVRGQVKGDSFAITNEDMGDYDLKIDGIKFDKTRTRQGTVWMDFTGDQHTFHFFVALKDGLTFDTPDELREEYLTYGKDDVGAGLRGDFRKIDSKRGFAHGIKRVKEENGLTAISDENTIKAITLLYEDCKARLC